MPWADGVPEPRRMWGRLRMWRAGVCQSYGNGLDKVRPGRGGRAVPPGPGVRDPVVGDYAAVPPAKSPLNVVSMVCATGWATPVPVMMMPSSRLLLSELLLMFIDPASTAWVDRP